MTLLELLELLKRNLKLVVLLPVVCTVCCALVVAFALPAEYSATSKITVSAEAGAIGSLATSAATEVAGDTGAEITAKADTTAKTITIEATSSDEKTAISAANKTAEKAASQITGVFSTATYKVASADRAENVSPGVVTYSAAAFLAGLFIAVCIVVLIDMAKNPVRSSEEIEEAYGVRKLGQTSKGKADAGREALLANVGFAGDGAKSVCVIPVGDPSYSVRTCLELAKTAGTAGKKTLLVEADVRGRSLESVVKDAEGGFAGSDAGLIEVLLGKSSLSAAAREVDGSVDFLGSGSLVCNPASLFGEDALAQFKSAAEGEYDFVVLNAAALTNCVDAAYVSRSVDATVLAIEEMATSHADLRETLRQLEIAKAKVIGFVTVGSEGERKERKAKA